MSDVPKPTTIAGQSDKAEVERIEAVILRHFDEGNRRSQWRVGSVEWRRKLAEELATSPRDGEG